MIFGGVKMVMVGAKKQAIAAKYICYEVAKR